MRCGNCEYTDGCVYTSFPPKVKCTITGEYHHEDYECNVIFSAKSSVMPREIEQKETRYDERAAVGSVNCLVCGATIVVMAGETFGPRICTKCKAAIMKIREG